MVIALEAKGTKAMPRTSKPSIFLFMRSISFLMINMYAYSICAHICYLSEGARNAGFSLGWISALDVEGRIIWIADAYRGDGKRFVVRADEKLTAFLELESVIRACPQIALTSRRDFWQKV